MDSDDLENGGEPKLPELKLGESNQCVFSENRLAFQAATNRFLELRECDRIFAQPLGGC